MEILKYPNEALTKVCSPVMHVGDRLREQAAQMLELMYENEGVGLAAPQVGLNLRMLVMNVIGNPETKDVDEYILINPIITHRIGGLTAMEEWCLSLPGERGKVKRATKVTFTAYQPDGTFIEQTWSGLRARVLQHECDHLDGIVFIDRAMESE